MEVFISNFYIYPKRNMIFECIPINFDFTVLSQFKSLCPKSHKIVSFLSKRFITKNRHREQNQCSTVPAGWNLDLNRRIPQTDRLEIPCMCQSSYIALSCKISLLFRQRTTKALIRLRGCAGWSAPLLFTYDKNRFSYDVAHFQINRSYLCRRKEKSLLHPILRWKNNCWFTIVGVIFAEDLLKINLLWLPLHVWGTVPCCYEMD